MAMTLLVTAEDVRERMGLQDLTDINTALESALVSSQLFVENALDSKLDYKDDNLNIFKLDIKRYGFLVPEGFFNLRLKRGFVEEDTSVVVTATTLAFTDATTLVKDTDYFIDLEKGVVMVSDAYDGNYVKVTYSSGFDNQSLTPPDWLKEAILSYVPVVLNNQQITNRNQEAEATTKVNANVTIDLVDSHARTIPFDVRPIL